MRKFKVLQCKQTRIVKEPKKVKTPEGAVRTVWFSREEKAGENGWWPGAYGHEKIKEGDILELEGFRAEKAANNPQFEEVFEPAIEPANKQVEPPEDQAVKPVKKVAKKKVGRPKKKVATA